MLNKSDPPQKSPAMQHIVHFTFISSLQSKVVLTKQTILPKQKSTTSETAAFETRRSLSFPSSAELWVDIDSQFLLRVDLLSGKFYLTVVTSTLVLKAVCLSLRFPCQQSKVFKQKALELPFPRHSSMNSELHRAVTSSSTVANSQHFTFQI